MKYKTLAILALLLFAVSSALRVLAVEGEVVAALASLIGSIVGIFIGVKLGTIVYRKVKSARKK